MDKQLLINTIEKLKPGIDSSGYSDENKLIHFTGKEAVSFNDEIFISIPFESDIMGSIYASEFLSLLKRIKKDKIVIEKRENILNIKGGRTKAGFNLIENIKIPDISLDDLEWKAILKDFIQGIEFCLFSVSKDINADDLKCVSIKNNYVCSSDNIRASRYEMEDNLDDILLIPLNTAKELKNYDFMEYSKRDNKIYFRNKNNVILSCVTMEENYFKQLENLFILEGDEINIPDKLKESIILSEILARKEEEGENKEIGIRLEKNKFICKGECDIGWIEDIIDIEYGGEDINFIVNSSIMGQIVEKAKTMVVGDNKVLFKGDNFEHVMAIRNE